MQCLRYSGYLVSLITMSIIMQQQTVEAKPFIFKFFVPQAPARTDSSPPSSSSSTISTGIDFTSILTTKLNLLSSLLRTGLSSGGFNIGFTKFFPYTQPTTTRRPYTSTKISTVDVEYEYESTTKSSFSSVNPTESSEYNKFTGTGNLSGSVSSNNSGNKAPNENIDHKYNISSVNSGNSDGSTTSEVDSDRNNKQASKGNSSANSSGTINQSIGYGYSTPATGYNYESPNQGMSENEISNEIMMISNQYLPAF